MYQGLKMLNYKILRKVLIIQQANLISRNYYKPISLINLNKLEVMSESSGTNKKIIIGVVSIAAVLVAGYFIHNRIQENKFKPVNRETIIKVLKKARKDNFAIIKKVSFAASKVAAQMRMARADPQVVRSVVEGPQFHLRIKETFEKNYAQACKQFGITDAQFHQSLDHYGKIQDSEIKRLVQQIEKDYEISLTGKLPDIKVHVPSHLTADKLIEIRKKLTLKRYLVQIDIFRKIRGKNQRELSTNQELLKSLPSPQEQQQKIYEQQGLGTNEEPASAVFNAALATHMSSPVRQKLQKIEQHYAKIFSRYQTNIQQNKITEDELNQLQDELIYNQCVV